MNRSTMTTAVGDTAGVAAGRDIAASLWAEISAAVVAALVVACFVLTSSQTPLPAVPWAAAFLFLAIHQDVRGLRIPNWLTLPSLALAIALATASQGAGGALSALAGAGVALAALFLPFAFRILGAGDVKAVMVLGALWGSEAILPALWWMAVAGGVLAIGLVAAQGGLVDLLRRWWKSARYSLLLRRIIYFKPADDSAAASGLPFAVAMGLGAVALQMWGMPWIS